VGARPSARRVAKGALTDAFRRAMTNPGRIPADDRRRVQRVANEIDRLINPPNDNVEPFDDGIHPLLGSMWVFKFPGG
jgi:hypothetical protein